MQKDTLIVVLSDMHSGSTRALCLNRQWQGKHQNYLPTEKQRAIYRHFEKVAEHVRSIRKGKRLILVHDGDAIEGIHHDGREVITLLREEQADIHIELMDWFMQKVRFERKNGDRLIYVSGTDTHVGDLEDLIGRDLGAAKNAEGGYVFHHLQLEVNKREFWFVHHGPKKGIGANEGNGMRNWLKNIYFEALKNRMRFPDAVISGHTHTPHYNTFVMDFHTIHGVICPSWQMKTRFAYRAAPVERNEIGAVIIDVSAAGDIRQPVILKMDTGSADVVNLTLDAK